jgi:hypothetical protein
MAAEKEYTDFDISDEELAEFNAWEDAGEPLEIPSPVVADAERRANLRNQKDDQ